MRMMPPVLLVPPRHVARHVDEGDDGDTEGVAEADEAGSLDRGLDVDDAGQVGRLLGDDAHAAPRQASEADDDVGGKVVVHAEEFAVVDDSLYHLVHVVGVRRVVRHQRAQLLVGAAGVVVLIADGRVVEVVLRQVGEKAANRLHTLVLGVEG